jgi:hypothetical protein
MVVSQTHLEAKRKHDDLKRWKLLLCTLASPWAHQTPAPTGMLGADLVSKTVHAMRPIRVAMTYSTAGQPVWPRLSYLTYSDDPNFML